METKPFYQSKTIQGAILAALPVLVQVLRLAGVDISPGEEQTVADAVVALTGLIGVLYAIYGRIVAKSAIQ